MRKVPLKNARHSLSIHFFSLKVYREVAAIKFDGGQNGLEIFICKCLSAFTIIAYSMGKPSCFWLKKDAFLTKL